MRMHATAQRKQTSWARVAALALALAVAALVGLAARPAHAQTGTCSTLINRLNRSLTGLCQGITSGAACYGVDNITPSFRQGQQATFSAPGNKAAISAFQSLRTNRNGAALLVSGAGSGRVKIILFGGSNTTPSASSQGSVFTLTTNNNTPVCQRTPSGMMLQTSGEPGSITVNGVRIDLASTAYVVVGGETLFDQNPSIDRRSGRRNPDAPLCSGFDSDCNFGQGSSRCQSGARLVYGPFCREDSYEQIRPGLYTVTLYGRGEVIAGATDYEASGRERFSFGSQRMSLPGSYSFCWPGLEPGGTGFETIVEPVSNNARVDHITLQYMGPDCDRTNPAALGSRASDIGMMTVYNVEGDVEISGDMGSASIPQANRMRVYYAGGQPVAMDEGPTDASYIVGGEMVEFLTWDEGGMPAIEPEGGESRPSEPVIELTDVSSPDPESNDLLRVEAYAYDAAVGDGNSDGVENVNFRVYDPFGNLVLDHDEQSPPFCLLGESGDGCAVFNPGDYDGVWPNGSDVVEGEYYIEATVRTDRGAEASTSTIIYLAPASGGSSGGDDVPPEISSVFSSPDDMYCGGEIEVTATVYDNEAVGEVYLRWRGREGEELPDYEWQFMEQVDDGTFSTALSAPDTNFLEFYVEAYDASGNSATAWGNTLRQVCID